MKRHSRWLLGTVLVGGLALAACRAQVPPSSTPPAEPPATTEPAAWNGKVTKVTEAEAPAALRSWVASQQKEVRPTYRSVAEGGAVWIAAAGGVKPSGGYQIAERRAQVVQGVLQVELEVVPPPKGAVTTDAITNPVAYFKVMPSFPGEVKVEIRGGELASPAPPNTYALMLERTGDGGTIQVRGIAPVAGVTVQSRSGNTVLVEKEVQVESGWYSTTLPAPDANLPDLKFIVLSGGQVVGEVPHRPDSPIGSWWSSNFYGVKAVQSGADSVQVEGYARIFEATFRSEIRAGGSVLATQTVHADRGAPEFGRFSASIQVPGGIPLGAEAWCIDQSMKDGSDIFHLIAPVVPTQKG